MFRKRSAQRPRDCSVCQVLAAVAGACQDWISKMVTVTVYSPSPRLNSKAHLQWHGCEIPHYVYRWPRRCLSWQCVRELPREQV